jgi:thiol-disulfide isomerase/thioredoxin
MPRRVSKRRDKESAPVSRRGPGKSQARARAPQGRVAALGALLQRPKVLYSVLGIAVVAGLAALVVFSVKDSLDRDFEFSMYSGADAFGADDVRFAELFPADKPLVLNFWAGACPPCRAEMPGFQAVYEDHGDEFTLLGLDVGPYMNLGSNNDARNLLQDLNITYPTGYARDSDAVLQHRVIVMPTTIFFTPDGEVFRREDGFINETKMTGIVQDLVRASGAPS